MKRQKMTKAELIEDIYNALESSISSDEVERHHIKSIIDHFFSSVKTALESNKIIELRGFGTFEVRSRKGRSRARNPRTGTIASVENHGVPIFRAGKELKKIAWSIVGQDGRKLD